MQRLKKRRKKKKKEKEDAYADLNKIKEYNIDPPSFQLICTSIHTSADTHM